MTYTVYNDLHLFSPHNSGISIDRVDGEITILAGDIVDYQNCKYEEQAAALNTIKALKDIYGDRYILGNHELRAIPCNGFYVHNGVLFKHGDHEFWGEKKLEKYMAKAKPGAGFLKRNVICLGFDKLRMFWPTRYKKKFKERAAEAARLHNCHTIVMGHKHPHKTGDFVYKGVRVIVLPRGKNIIQL